MRFAFKNNTMLIIVHHELLLVQALFEPFNCNGVDSGSSMIQVYVLTTNLSSSVLFVSKV